MTHPEQFTEKQWNKWVRRGTALVRAQTSIQFDLGDITLEMFPKQPNGANRGVKSTLARFAIQIGVSPERLLAYRHVAIAWPDDRRNLEVSFAIHEILAALRPSLRYRKINQPPVDPVSRERRWTVNEALRAVGRSPHYPVTQQERVDRVRDLVSHDSDALLAMKDILKRPTVVRELMDDASSRHIIRKAERARLADEAADELVEEWISEEAGDSFDPSESEQAESPTISALPPSELSGNRSAPSAMRPIVDYSTASREVLEVLGVCTAFYTQMQSIIPRLHVSEFDSNQATAMVESLKRVRASAEWAETAINTGDTTMDEALEKLLGGDAS